MPLHSDLHPAHQLQAWFPDELALTHASVWIQGRKPVKLGRQLQMVVHGAMSPDLVQLCAHVGDVKLRSVHIPGRYGHIRKRATHPAIAGFSEPVAECIGSL